MCDGRRVDALKLRVQSESVAKNEYILYIPYTEVKSLQVESLDYLPY